MEEREIKELLRSENRDNNRRGWRCPEENKLAAYVMGQLGDEKRHGLEKHFTDCEACLQSLAFLARSFEEAEFDAVPSHILVRARALAAAKPRGSWRWQWITATATACVLIVAVFVIWRVRLTQKTERPVDLVAENQVVDPAKPSVMKETPSPDGQQPTRESKPPKANVPVVRGENMSPKPVVISPRNDAALSTGNLTVRWTPVIDASVYEVRVVSSDGALVLSETTSRTELTTTLKPDAKYFVKVVATLSDNRSISSELVSFRVVSR